MKIIELIADALLWLAMAVLAAIILWPSIRAVMRHWRNDDDGS